MSVSINKKRLSHLPRRDSGPRIRSALGLLLLVLQALFLCGTALASTVPSRSIMLVPLAYYGPDEKSPLTEEIREGLSRRLESAGHTVIPYAGTPPETSAEAIAAGRSREAEAVVYGSVSLIGGSLSLDLRLIYPDAPDTETVVLVAQGQRQELSGLLDRIDNQLGNALSASSLVQEVSVKGNRRSDTDAILQNIETRKGERLDPATVSSDIKAIYGMGFFEDVQVDTTESPAGRRVVFVVKEKPAIRNIKFSGNSTITEEKIKEAIDLKPYTIIQEKTLQENVEKIKALYAEKGYSGMDVVASVEPVSEQAADVTFEITEGEKVRIKTIEFLGNEAFSDKELEDLMETSEKKSPWIPSWRTIVALFKGDAAVLKWDALERDLGRISAYYHNQGYVDAKVGHPDVRRQDAWLFISIPVEEGDRYGVGNVDIEEDLFKDKQALLAKLQTPNQEVFNQEMLRQDILKLTDLYADEGYAYADVTPKITKDPAEKLVNIVLSVNRGPKVTFDRIEIVGNTRTRDKVIRRELRVNELEPFSASGLRKSRQRLGRLGYFEDINMAPTKGGDEDRMNLEVQVKERPTGTFSIGAGYSSVDKLILMGEISQRNLLGRGQILNFRGIIGSTTNRYSMSFTEPYFRDTNVSLGFELYNWEREYDDYTKESTGGAVNAGYPLTDDLSLFMSTRMDNTVLSDVSEYASSIIKDSEDITSTRAVSVGLNYDTRDDFYFPTTGWQNTVSVEYAGGPLGGDSAYVKLQGVAGYYYPIWKQLIGHARGGLGYVTEGSDGKLPVYERFFLGGIDSIRGYKYGRVSPIDPETGDRVGGNYMGYLQLESIFPLVKDMGLNGVCFLDMGNVWDDESKYDVSNLRKSVGLGVRWLSPMGPLRIEWGYNIDTEPGDDSSNWEFRMGGTF
jgi:outer membrane protein insertion porin family